MKKKLFAIGFSMLLLFGCSDDQTTSTKTVKAIKVLEHVPDSYRYQDHKSVISSKEVEKIAIMLENREWKEEQEEYLPPPDYSFTLNQNETYSFWMEEDGRIAAIYKENLKEYTDLTETESKDVYKILVDK